MVAGAGTVAADEPTPPADGDPLQQNLDPGQATGRGHAILDRGHVDIGPRLIDGSWSIAIHDDTANPPVWRHPDDVVFKVSDAAHTVAPTDSDYDFLGDAAGNDVWVIPQTQNRDVVWAGWNTQDPDVMEHLQRGATFTLHGVAGPGEMFVFLQSGVLGAPDLLWSSTEAAPQDLFVAVNTHTHANWVFTKPGVYLVDFEISGTLLGGEKVSDRQPLRFAVGDNTDPDAAFAASMSTQQPAPGEAVPTGTSRQPTSPETAADPGATNHPDEPETQDTAPSSAHLVIWLTVAVIAVIMIGGLIATTIRTRRRKAEAARTPTGREDQ